MLTGFGTPVVPLVNRTNASVGPPGAHSGGVSSAGACP